MKFNYILKLLFLLLTLFCISYSADAEYVFPIDISYKAVSGSFGEFRYGRVHTGVDFATFGKTGLPVRAVMDGWIYRIRSSPGGYGNVIYIDHNRRKRTVYAHLERFSDKIAQLLPNQTDPLGGDENGKIMEIKPKKKIQIRKGEIIGWSGESGLGHPHFHFEYRNTNDKTLNPIRNKILEVEDNIAPVIEKIILEPADEFSSVEGSGWPIELDSTTAKRRVNAKGKIRVLVKVRDIDGKSGGTMSIDRLKLEVNGKPWSTLSFSSISFDTIREAVKLYDQFLSGFSPTNYVIDMTAPDNTLGLLISKGFLSAENTKNLQIKISAFDAKDNVSHYLFRIDVSDTQSGNFRKTYHTEYISRGGIMLRRGEEEFRITESNNNIRGFNYVISNSERERFNIAGGGSITNIEKHFKIYSFIGGDLPAPQNAVSEVIHIGPYGYANGYNMELSVPSGNKANGLAIYTNGSWQWLLSSRNFNNFNAEILYLAPIVLVKDTVPPQITLDTELNAIRIVDDFSGVDALKVDIKEEETGRNIKGRYDIDRKAFILSKSELKRESIRLVAAARDNAGNRIKKILELWITKR